jgi:tetratricopeptide (TPR) repeat protein
MDKQKSKTAGFSNTTTKAEQDTVSHRRINMQMVQNVLLIWLDTNIDDNSIDCRNTIAQLRCIVNSINTFTNADQCVDFLTNIDDENVCMIISGALCRNLVPLIHDIVQLRSIFFFCENKTVHEQWAKSWSKIKDVFTEISSICEVLEQVAQQCEQNAIPISFLPTSGDASKKNLDQLNPSFMYTQILKEILLEIKFEEKHITEFLDYCQEQFVENDRELRNIKKFEEKYRDETPIWWYTYECFLYPMLNRALRLMDVDIIIRMGFFINDLHRHIEQLHNKQFVDRNVKRSFTVYRGQGMSTTDFEQLIKTKGGLISFNNFLSTSKNRDVSLSFARRALRSPDMVGILFIMTIDPLKSTTPFASITDVSFYKDREDEVLFAMHTVFRVDGIKHIDENHSLVQVELALTSDNDKDLRVLTDCIREETFPDEGGWPRLGLVLLKMGQPERAQQVYEILLEQATEERAKAPIYHQLGCIKDAIGDYQKAITFYEKDLEIIQKSLPPNHPRLAMSYNNIGIAYISMGEYSKALSSHEKALEIQQQSLPPNHPALAASYGNIGIAYRNMGEYSKALSSHEKVLEIRQQSLPPNHPALADFHNNSGNVYFNMGEYSKALLSHKKALAIRQKSLPPNHPNLAMSYNNIGAAYDNMNEYSKALSSFEKALAIQQQSLPPNHPNLAISYNNIGAMYENMDDYLKAHLFYQHAVGITQHSLPSDHYDLQTYRKNLDRLKQKL